MRRSPMPRLRRGAWGVLCLAASVLLAPAVASAGVVGSLHDFSSTGPYPPTWGTGTQLSGPCAACHRAHKGEPLKTWPRTLTEETTTFDQANNPNYIAGSTLLCYDCHDNANSGELPNPAADDSPPWAAWNASRKAQDVAFDSVAVGRKVGYYELANGDKPTPGGLPAPGALTGGHYWQSEPTGNPDYVQGDKIHCELCHDPHRTQTGTNMVFFRTVTWHGNGTISLSTYGTNKSASDNTRSGLQNGGANNTGREMCAECHGYATGGGTPGAPKTLFQVLLPRPPSSIADHLSTSAVPCTNCHKHNMISASCTNCHGNATAGNYWPDSVSTAAGGNGTVYPNRLGVHAQHVNAIAGARFGPAATMANKNSTCITCHPAPGGGNHDSNGVPLATADVHRDSNNLTTHFLTISGATNGTTSESYANGTAVGQKSCTGVDCHYRVSTPSTGSAPAVGWMNTAQSVNCASCHGMGTSGATLPNAHMQHIGGGPGQKGYPCYYCHPSGWNNQDYLASHQTGVANWNFLNTLDPTGTLNELYGGAATGTKAVTYGGGTYQTCASVYCHIQTSPAWNGTIGATQCLLCHLKNQTAAPNPSSGLHYGSTAPAVTARWHDDTLAAGGCTVCHTAMTAQASHVNGGFQGGLGETAQMSLIADYKQSADGIGTCYGTVVVNGAACHAGPGELGTWARQWNAGTHYTVAGDVSCAGCHGGLENDWTFGTGAHNTSDGSVEHGYADWDAIGTADVVGRHYGSTDQANKCNTCHVYPNNPYPRNGALRIGWVGNAANNSTYHGNNSIEMNRTLGYATTGADAYGCTSNCHQSGVIRMERSGWTVNLLAGPGGCTACHGNDVAGTWWPDGVSTATGGRGTVYPNRVGVHVQHVEEIARARFGASPTLANRNATCLTCHPSPGVSGHESNEVPLTTADVHRDANNTGTHFLTISGATNTVLTDSYANGTVAGQKTCTNVDCHYRTATPTSGAAPNIGWMNTAQAVTCSSCHGMGTAGTALPNAHPQHVGNAAGQKAYPCWYCHPSGAGNANYAMSHQSGAANWSFATTLDPAGYSETYAGAATGSTATKYGTGAFSTCAATWCHIQTSPAWNTTIAPSQCLLCHQKGQAASTPNPASGLHYLTTAPVVTGRWHDDTIGTAGCPSCHTAMSGLATHVNGTFQGGVGQTAQMSLIADYKQSAVDGVGTCYGTVVVNAAACHGGPGETGGWQREWNAATHYSASADVPCAGCHGGMGTLPTNDWSFGTGAHNTTDGSVEHAYALWDTKAAYDVIGASRHTGATDQTNRCDLCHVYPTTGYVPNASGRIGWVGNAANNSTYHGNNSIEMNRTTGYQTSGANAYGCTSNCHPGGAVIKMEGSRWRVNLINGPAGSCEGCHNGSIALAPNVMTYWTGSATGQDGGHGDAGGAAANLCVDCHDIGQPTSPASAAHLNGTYNSLWDNTTRSTNTAHLKAEFFTKYPGGSLPTDDYGIQVAFDNYCMWECHNLTHIDKDGTVPGHRHSLAGETEMTLASYIVEFNTAHSLPYPGDTIPGIPVDADLNTNAVTNGSKVYAPCISCHDPHGTGTAKPPVGGYPSNYMLRDLFPPSEPALLCAKCHWP